LQSSSESIGDQSPPTISDIAIVNALGGTFPDGCKSRCLLNTLAWRFFNGSDIEE
jgi:hypothetical protein